MEALPTTMAHELSRVQAEAKWMIEGLWLDRAVGIIGAQPKCGKSFLALDIAVAVASGARCLRHYPVLNTGPVILYAAEDALCEVRNRLEGICRAAGVTLEEMPISKAHVA
jgi:RecA-family ATPase